MRLLLLSIHYMNPAIDPRVIDDLMSQVGGDWIRVNALTWFIWTDRPTVELGHLIQRTVHAGDTFVIVRVMPEAAAGWAPGWVFDWLNARMLEEVDRPPRTAIPELDQ